MEIFNLTQHNGTPEQVAQGLVEPSPEVKEGIKNLLTFSGEDIRAGLIVPRAKALAVIAQREGAEHVLIGGLPALMGPLERALRAEGITPIFAHSERRKVDQHQPDGSVKTVGVFVHEFFYPAPR